MKIIILISSLISKTGDRGVFACTSGEDVNLDQLCDGNRDCGGGDDETTPLCESEYGERLINN